MDAGLPGATGGHQVAQFAQGTMAVDELELRVLLSRQLALARNSSHGTPLQSAVPTHGAASRALDAYLSNAELRTPISVHTSCNAAQRLPDMTASAMLAPCRGVVPPRPHRTPLQPRTLPPNLQTGDYMPSGASKRPASALPMTQADVPDDMHQFERYEALLAECAREYLPEAPPIQSGAPARQPAASKPGSPTRTEPHEETAGSVSDAEPSSRYAEPVGAATQRATDLRRRLALHASRLRDRSRGRQVGER